MVFVNPLKRPASEELAHQGEKRVATSPKVEHDPLAAQPDFPPQSNHAFLFRKETSLSVPEPTPISVDIRDRSWFGLEATADDTRRMTEAFSNLTRATELALSLDNGLGWLRGPDITWRQKLCNIKPEIFTPRYNEFTHEEEMQREAWEQLLRHLNPLTPIQRDIPLKKLKSLDQIPYLFPPLPSSTESSSTDDGPRERLLGGLGRVNPTIFSSDLQTRRYPAPPSPRASVSEGEQASPEHSYTEFILRHPYYEEYIELVSFESFESIAYDWNTEQPSYWHPGNNPIVPGRITPNALTRGQMEWLLETDWAHRAFLSSYTLATIDNRAALQNVRILYIARIPSKYLDMLRRHDFWAALENPEALSMFVTPDWHEIMRTGEDHVWLKRLLPSSPIRRFYDLLSEFVGPLERVEKLRIGWSEGGEFAPGMFARNQHVMPGPVVPSAGQMYPNVSVQQQTAGELESLEEHPTQTEDSVVQLLDLPHVGHFTLSNCWISFQNLTDLTKKMRAQSLRVIWLDSVSLSSLDNIPGLPPGHIQPNPAALHHHHNHHLPQH
ncbi:MAG: hypothetical protein M1816_002226 [Peltula sp. TS41687]|nr:MAG: hypothetical protein M1816_002226 [Peltula sp. TS41687]